MEAAKRAHPRAKRRKLQLKHSDEQRNTTMEQLPEDAMVLIISFLCYGSIQDIAGLYCRFGRVSRFCRRSSIRFPQLVPVEWYDDSGEATLVTVRTFRVVAFLCHNPIKVKSFGALKFTSDLDVNIISYMMKECNISCLREIKLEFNEVGDFTKSSDYEKTIAIAAGIPEDAVYKKNNGAQEDVQKQIAQILSERARCIKNLTIYAKSFHVDLPKAISTHLEFVHLHFNDWFHPADSDALSRTIEALPRLRHLSLFSKGDLSIRSKSLEQLNYWGDEGPQECICPLLKVLKLTVLEPGTPKLLSSFVHAIKKFKLEIAADGRIHDWEEEHWERWRNATLRYTQIIEAMPELRHFSMRDDQIYGAIKELRIRSASLETISIVKSPYCKFRECICPCLRSLQCTFFKPSKAYQLLLTNNDTAAHIYKYRRKSIKSINCPCVGIEVPDDCMLVFKRKKMTMVLANIFE